MGNQISYGPDDPIAVPVQYEVPLAGGSITARSSILQLEPAGTLATLTIVLPDGPDDGQQFRVTSTAAVTALTLTPGDGDTVLAAIAPSALTANTGVNLYYLAENQTWYQLP